MPRMARLVVPGYPHHITQRGCRRQQTFFEPADYRAYLDLMANRKADAGVDIWGYCLMPNHVHLIAVPEHKSSLAMLFRTVHRKYSLQVNAAHDWRGHLWQERFYSCVMDEPHLLATFRYVELNPVRAGLCDKAGDWSWSSARAHLFNESDYLVSRTSVTDQIHDWHAFLAEHDAPNIIEAIRAHTRTGRPAGEPHFIENLERLTGKQLRVRRPSSKMRK